MYLRTEYQPRRINGQVRSIAPKTLRNIWITLSSLFTWLQTEFNHPSPMHEVPAPKFQKAEIQPFTQDEIVKLLKASQMARETRPSNRQAFTARRRTAYRDQATVLLSASRS